MPTRKTYITRESVLGGVGSLQVEQLELLDGGYAEDHGDDLVDYVGAEVGGEESTAQVGQELVWHGVWVIYGWLVIFKRMGNADGKLLLVGLDNSGKTTILSRIIDPDRFNTDITPTIGFKKSTFSRNGIDF